MASETSLKARKNSSTSAIHTSLPKPDDSPKEKSNGLNSGVKDADAIGVGYAGSDVKLGVGYARLVLTSMENEESDTAVPWSSAVRADVSMYSPFPSVLIPLLAYVVRDSRDGCASHYFPLLTGRFPVELFPWLVFVCRGRVLQRCGWRVYVLLHERVSRFRSLREVARNV